VSGSALKRSLSWSLRDEHGAASVVALAMLAVLLTVTVVVVHLGAATVARHRAQAAADLGALAAAVRLADGMGAACAAADAVINAMGAGSGGCSVQGLDVVIAVEVPVSIGSWGTGQAVASARAGPVSDYP
jgi:secretion/DNA translocation related TadE-like protein